MEFLPARPRAGAARCRDRDAGHCRAAVRQYEPRVGRRIFLRRHHRGADQRARQRKGTARHLAHGPCSRCAGRTWAIRELGEELKVGTLLEGSVRREGSALRITAQLINVSDGYHLWSNTYDRELKSIFAVEDEIARSIASALQRTLVGVKPPTTDLKAHDLYLKGRYFWNKRTSEALRKSVVFFEDAIRHDPGYALAYCGLADALAQRIDYDNARPSEVLPKAKEAALRALELEPGLAEAHAALGNVANFQNDWTVALAENRKAVELNPNYAMAQKWIGNVLMLTGRLQEARDAFERTLQLDPTSLIATTNVGDTYFYQRDYPKAIAQFSKTLEMD
jgi:tetratricopeptide (TPR) repeat protein